MEKNMIVSNMMIIQLYILCPTWLCYANVLLFLCYNCHQYYVVILENW